MDRRSFLIGGGAFALCRPGFATAPETSGIRPLSVVRRNVEVGVARPFRVMHISDTHLASAYPDEHPDKIAAAARRSQGFGGRQEEALAESLEWARHNTDYVIHTGDLIDFQSRRISTSCESIGVKPCSGQWATTSSTRT